VVTVRALFVALAAALVVAGCSGGSDGTDARPAGESESPSLASAGPPRAGICPLTLPNERTPRGQADAGMNHGNGKLWTAMWPHNVLIASGSYIRPDGSVWMKWPWWRRVKGRLTVTGRRLDGEAPPLTAAIPSGYGDRGFQPSGITFPTEGCWEVTGAAGSARLTFVTLVLKAERYWPKFEAATR
jgi:hypothetical protein